MNLPEPLIQSLQKATGFNEDAFKAVHQSGAQIVSIRVNPSKPGQRKTNNEQLEKVPWSSNGYYLPERPSFTLDPLFHAGAYYVQEASSMFLEEALKQSIDLTKPLRVLDLCAAPGGKSTLIQSVISKESLLVSNEVIKTRVNILAENIAKWGAANVIVTNNDPADFKRLAGYFDVIVVDAPCSGSGLFRKDLNAINEWSENNVALCAQRQQRILADILPSLKEGGVLIYSTCSYSQAEDEDIINWLKKQYSLFNIQFSIPDDWGIVQSNGGYRFYPDKVKGEGFFIAAFKNPARAVITNEVKNHPWATLRTKIKSKAVFTIKEIETIKSFLLNADDFFFIKQNEEVIALPVYFENDLPIIQSALYIKKAGIKLGALIRNELLPAHELAVSNIINPAVTKIEIDKEAALQYLRKAAINFESEIKGWVLVTYEQLPLGWVKVMANRCNNYYPAAWRILNK